MSPRKEPDDWAEWSPAEHVRAAQRLTEGEPAPGVPIPLAQMHVQLAQAKSAERLFALLAGRIQYVDTRRMG